MRTPALVLVMFSWLPALAVAQLRPGAVDPTFAYPTPTTIEPDSTNFVPMPEGWLVVKSRLPTDASAPTELELDRIDSNGQPLAAFGSSSSRTQSLPRRLNVATAGKRLASGKLLLGGFEAAANGASVAALVRLDAEGNFDPSFGQGGVVTYDAMGDLDRIAAVEELPDGQLVALVWSRLEHIPYDCPNGRMTLLTVGADGTSETVFHSVDGPSFSGLTCLVPMSLQIDADGRAIYGGGSFQVFENGSMLLDQSDIYGPFVRDPSLGLVSTTVNGDMISLETNMTTGDAYGGLGIAAGFSPWITWNALAVDDSHGVAYLGFATGDAKVGVARFRLSDRSLDSGWGNSNGVVSITTVGHGSPFYGEGIAKDVRLLQAQPKGDVIVGTADGILVRLKGGDGVAHGAFGLTSPTSLYPDPNYGEPIFRGTDAVLKVRRIGGSVGAVSVDYATTPGNCDDVSNRPCASASAGQDYVNVSGTLSWADGDTSTRSITVHIPAATEQPDEILAVTLSNAAGGAGMLRQTVFLHLVSTTTAPPPPPPAPPPPTGVPGVSSGGGRVDGSLLGLLLLGATLARRRRGPVVQRA